MLLEEDEGDEGLLFDDDEREKEVEDEEGLHYLDFLYALYVD